MRVLRTPVGAQTAAFLICPVRRSATRLWLQVPNGNSSESRDPVSLVGRRRATRLRANAGAMIAARQTKPKNTKESIDMELKQVYRLMRRTNAQASCRARCHQTVRVAACLYEMNANRMDVPCEFMSKVPLRRTSECLCDVLALETAVQKMIAAEQPLEDSGENKERTRAHKRAGLFMKERTLRTWFATTNANKGHAPGIAAARSEWRSVHRRRGPAVGTHDPNKQKTAVTRWLHRWRAKWRVRSGRFKVGDRLSQDIMRAKAWP